MAETISLLFLQQELADKLNLCGKNIITVEYGREHVVSPIINPMFITKFLSHSIVTGRTFNISYQHGL